MDETTKFRRLLIIVIVLLIIAFTVEAGTFYWILKRDRMQVDTANIPIAAVVSADKAAGVAREDILQARNEDLRYEGEMKDVKRKAADRVAVLSDDAIAARWEFQLRRWREYKSADVIE